jgi:hypothetical protein
MVEVMERSATLSPCRAYRYALWRRWGRGPYAMFIGLGDEAPRDTSTTLAAHMTLDEFFAEAKRLKVRLLGTPEEVRATLDSKDAEIQRLTAENAALRAEVEQLNALVDHLRDNIYERMTGVPPLKATAPKEGLGAHPRARQTKD